MCRPGGGRNFPSGHGAASEPVRVQTELYTCVAFGQVHQAGPSGPALARVGHDDLVPLQRADEKARKDLFRARSQEKARDQQGCIRREGCSQAYILGAMERRRRRERPRSRREGAVGRARSAFASSWPRYHLGAIPNQRRHARPKLAGSSYPRH